MSERPNALTLRAFYACFENEDYATRVKVFLAPSVVWHVAGNNPLSGDFRGPDAAADQMLQYERHSRGTLRLDTSIMASHPHAVAIHLFSKWLPTPLMKLPISQRGAARSRCIPTRRFQ